MHPKLWSSWPDCHLKNQVSAAATHSLRHVNVWTPRHPSDPSRKTCWELGTEFLVPKSAEQYEENIMILHPSIIDLDLHVPWLVRGQVQKCIERIKMILAPTWDKHEVNPKMTNPITWIRVQNVMEPS